MRGPELQQEDEDEAYKLRRRPTDVLCLVIFLAFVAGMCKIAHFAFQNGQSEKLIAGLSYNGLMCGVDELVAQQPFLMWCPDATAPITNGMPESLNLDQPICVDACPTDAGTTLKCPQAPEVSEQMPIPGQFVTTIRTVTKSMNSYATTAVGSMYCLPDYTAMGEEQAEFLSSQLLDGDTFASPYHELERAFATLTNTKYLVAIMLLLALVLSYAYLFALSKVTKVLIYASFICVIFLGTAVGAALLAFSFFPEHSTLFGDFFHVNASLFLPDHNNKVSVLVSQILGVALLLVAFLIALLVCWFHDTIDRVAACIEAACDAIRQLPSLWVEPCIGALVKGAALVVMLIGLAFLISLGEVESKSVNIASSKITGVGRTFAFPQDEQIMLFYYLFGIFWVMETIDACQSFIISYAVVKWYSLPNPKTKIVCMPLLNGFLRCVTFHLGSMACGAFLIATTRIISFVLWLISREAERSGNAVGACLANTCLCCMECFRKCLEYINKNAYVDIVINSNNFFRAAKNSFLFMKEYAPDIMLLNGACWFAQVSGVLTITGAGAGVLYLLTTTVDRWSSPDSDQYVPDPLSAAIFAGVVCGSVGWVSLTLFDDVANTLLVCYADTRKRGISEKHAPAKFAADVEKQVAFALIDSDHDGKITKSELQAARRETDVAGGLLAQFDRFDLDHDGIISQREFDQGYDQLEDQGGSRCCLQ